MKYAKLLSYGKIIIANIVYFVTIAAKMGNTG